VVLMLPLPLRFKGFKAWAASTPRAKYAPSSFGSVLSVLLIKFLVSYFAARTTRLAARKYSLNCFIDQFKKRSLISKFHTIASLIALEKMKPSRGSCHLRIRLDSDMADYKSPITPDWAFSTSREIPLNRSDARSKRCRASKFAHM
jgi:hypothetical protein